MLTFKKFNDENKGLLKEWFSDDKHGMKYLASYANISEFQHLINFKSRHFWFVEKDDQAIGFFDFEIENEDRGYFSFYLIKQARGKGLGKVLLEEALQLPEVKSVSVIEGGVEKDNHSSIKILEKSGFRYRSTDKDDMLMYQKKRQKES